MTATTIDGAVPARVLEQLTQVWRRGEAARTVRLNRLAGHLLAFGRIAWEDVHVARLIVVTAPVEQCDLGLVHVRWTAQQTALGSSLCGWVAARVGDDKKLLLPGAGDLDRVQDRLRELGLLLAPQR